MKLLVCYEIGGSLERGGIAITGDAIVTVDELTPESIDWMRTWLMGECKRGYVSKTGKQPDNWQGLTFRSITRLDG